MPRKRGRNTKQIKLITSGGGPAPVCWCGSSKWAYDFRRFPMRHVSRCLSCDVQLVVTIRIPPGKPPKPPDPEPGPWSGWPPFWLG